MVMRKRVEAVLERMRPFMQADGGDIELVEVDGNSASVRLTGTCLRRPSTHMAIYFRAESALRSAIPEFEILRLL
jgi:Fe-S cluster biogenesis protein NfuA